MCPQGDFRLPTEKQDIEKLLSILNICQRINSERDIAVLLDLIAHETTRLMDAERASIFILDRENNELWSQVTLGSEPIRLDANLGIAGAVVLTGQIINARDVSQDPRFYSGIDARKGFRTCTILAVPLKNYEGEITGVFEVLNKKKGYFDKNDEEILKAMAAQVAIAIETVQLVQELKWHRDQLLKENSQLMSEIKERFSTKNIIGTSEKIQSILKLIQQISNSSVNVLITGESGTGKELIARAIHFSSLRASRSFIALNCAALPESLVESELFGIEKGVATGVEQQIGKFEMADGGTLFLDEIGDLSLLSQAKILRVLQEGVVDGIGSKKTISVDVRIIAATNKNLEAEIKEKHFREDLFYRLKVIHIETPPLREIKEDIPLLAHYFLERYCAEMKKGQKKLTPAVLTYLANYSWPGNVRELENEIKRLVVLSQGKVISKTDLSENIYKGGKDTHPQLKAADSLKETVEKIEVSMIREVLQRCRGNQLQTAKTLGLSRQGLIKKMKRYGLKSL
jgi:Nif-specific regulatory protein